MSRRRPMAAPADSQRTDATRSARRAERAPSGGWRTIAAKEFADHLGSVRFFVLLIVVAIAAIVPMYFISTDLSNSAPQVAGSPALFLALFVVGVAERRRGHDGGVRGAARAAGRDRVRVRRHQQRAQPGHAVPAARPADPPRRHRQRQVRRGHRGDRGDARGPGGPRRRRWGSCGWGSSPRPRSWPGSCRGCWRRSCTPRSGSRSRCCCRWSSAARPRRRWSGSAAGWA